MAFAILFEGLVSNGHTIYLPLGLPCSQDLIGNGV